ncbi:MAG: recombinase family protein [Candidatus Omnitrophica bacterium]|nr:recombinase family protein [Candidatus Omnitrophota bacterium]
MKNEPEKKKNLVCAIYTRKSTTEGLDQDFTTLDNQRESAVNYIKSQQHEGWTVSEEMYDDGGFTGANTDRPALQKLINDIKLKRINCVVVYKVDRLSRSLLDFSQLLQFFDEHGVAFVSITQQFNTNTSMGRLTLNILLSFAQFEREIISERTKDKMGAARKRGQWLGGKPPLGYKRDDKAKKLVIVPEEAELVRRIFDLYLTGHPSVEIAQILSRDGILSRPWTQKNGTARGNKRFGNTRVLFILKNHLYIGKLKYGGQIYLGQQPAIIDEDTFNKAQEMIKNNRVDRKNIKNTSCTGFLSYLLKCKSCGAVMTHTYSLKKGKYKYRYYVCTSAQKHGYSSCPNKSIPAQVIEDAVIDRLKMVLPEQAKNMPGCKTEVEAFLSPVWDTLLTIEKRRLLRRVIKEIDCDIKTLKLGFTFHDLPERIEFDAMIRRSGPGKRWRKDVAINREPRIRKALILAHHLKRLMKEGRIKHTTQASEWLRLSLSEIDHTLSLLLLSPVIQEDILTGNGTYFEQIPEYKIRLISAEPDWDKQLPMWQDAKLTFEDLALSDVSD